MRRFIQDIVRERYLFAGARRRYVNLYKQIIAHNPGMGLNVAAANEEEWLKRWRKYDKHVSPLGYRIFSKYVGEDLNIMPLEVCVNIVEPVLCPEYYRGLYSDKNSLTRLYPGIPQPKVLLRNIDGHYYDENYKQYKGDAFVLEEMLTGDVIVKPSCSQSGVGVRLFQKQLDGRYVDSNNNILTKEFLEDTYKQNFLLQERFQQSDFLAQFNASSTNTLRISTYRDRQGEPHVLGVFLRIGGANAIVDNAHGGGVFCNVSLSGELGKCVYDMWGRREVVFGGKDFGNTFYRIPNFMQVLKFAENVAATTLHHDLLALDILLDKKNNPVLLEVNVGGFAGWSVQMTSGAIFGSYTAEVMDYCTQVSARPRFMLDVMGR